MVQTNSIKIEKIINLISIRRYIILFIIDNYVRALSWEEMYMEDCRSLED